MPYNDVRVSPEVKKDLAEALDMGLGLRPAVMYRYLRAKAKKEGKPWVTTENQVGAISFKGIRQRRKNPFTLGSIPHQRASACIGRR